MNFTNFKTCSDEFSIYEQQCKPTAPDCLRGRRRR